MIYLSEILGRDPTLKGNISFIYNVILNFSLPSTEKIRCAWEQDLGVQISAQAWKGSLDFIHTSSLCLRQSLIQFKMVHRLHLSRDRLAATYPNTDPNCLRCHQGIATIGYMYWSCSALTNFWTQIFEVITVHICAADSITAVFGETADEIQISTSQACAIAFARLLARRFVLRQWKSVPLGL